jgi:hypothetical protein
MVLAGLLITLTIGWIIRAGTAAKSSRAVLGFAGIIGMVAAITASSLIAPIVVADSRIQIHHLMAENVPPRLVPVPNGKTTVTHPDQDYLTKFLEPEEQGLEGVNAALKLQTVLENTVFANRVYAAAIGGWVTQFMAMVIFLALCVSSTWAVDYLARSGRRLPARIGCYIELYLPVIGLLNVVAGLLELGIAIFVMDEHFYGTPWQTFMVAFTAMIVWAVTAHVGVVRRWRPLIRIGLYAAGIGLTIGALILIYNAERALLRQSRQSVAAMLTPSPR